jgi:hypothetical protein
MSLRGEMTFPVADLLNAAGIPYVFASGYSRDALPERFSGVPFLEKPFAPEQMVALLGAAMKAAAALAPPA